MTGRVMGIALVPKCAVAGSQLEIKRRRPSKGLKSQNLPPASLCEMVNITM